MQECRWSYTSLLILLGLLASVACGMSSAGASDLSQIKSIGVISAVGDTLHHKYVGSTAFTNKEDGEDIAEWKIDEFIISELTSQLGGRFEVRPVAYTKSDFYPDTGGIFAHSDLDVEARVGRIRPTDGSGPDAYLVVTNLMNDDFIMQTNQHLFGAGLYRRHGLFGGNLDAVYASCAVTLIDGRTGKKLDDIVMLMSDRGLFGRSPPSQTVKDLWNDQFVMTSDQQAQALDALKSILSKGTALSLTRLELLPKQ